MSYLKITLPLFIIFALLLPTQVAAHILSTDGDIGGVIHLNPDDDPIILQETEGAIEVKDKSGKLRAVDCNCEIVILRQIDEVYRQKVNLRQEGENAIAHFIYTFPAKDIYTIKLKGSPVVEGRFQEFELSYDFRITREAKETTPGNLSPIIIGGVVGLATLGVIAARYLALAGRQRKTRK